MRSAAALSILLCSVGWIACKPSSPCPSGQFMLKSQCVLCHPTCTECDGHELFECTTCGVGKYSACHSCEASCKTCFGPQGQDCSSCFKGYFLDQDGSCVAQCPPGTYANSATQLCEDCSPNCEACSGTSDNCISCSKGSFKLFLHQGRCWSNCPEGFFETAMGVCESCDSSCLTCDGSKSQCLSCTDGYYLGGGTCRLNCSLRTYPAEDGTCRRCPPHCDVCSDDRTCFKCSFLYLMLNGVCKASCPLGFYEDMDEGRCGQCHPTCATCSGPLADDCETCSIISPKLYKGACYKDCITGTYYEAEARECQECHQTCSTCAGPDPNQCTQCKKGLVLDPNTLFCGVTGDTDCPDGTYLHDDQFTCMGCHPECHSCEGPGENECQTCHIAKYLQNRTCVKECPSGMYTERQEADGEDVGFCLPCDHICATCTGASPRDCLTCSLGYLRLQDLCVTHCPSGYYREGYHCEKCDQSCELCTGPGPDSCRACPPPLLELQGTKLCVESCLPRFYQLNDICKQCHTSCQTCTDGSPQSCLSCDMGGTLKDKVCYPRCEEGRYFSEQETCEPCHDSCRHCIGPRPDQCLTCHRDFALHAVENRCARCCQNSGNDTDCCVCDSRSALCVEALQPKSGDVQETDLKIAPRAVHHTSAALPVSLLLALGLALAVYVSVKAHARKRFCWSQSYERLRGSASVNMPHGVPEPDSGDEVDVVYTSRGGSVYRRYSFIHEQDNDADQDVDESTCLNQS